MPKAGDLIACLREARSGSLPSHFRVTSLPKHFRVTHASHPSRPGSCQIRVTNRRWLPLGRVQRKAESESPDPSHQIRAGGGGKGGGRAWTQTRAPRAGFPGRRNKAQ